MPINILLTSLNCHSSVTEKGSVFKGKKMKKLALYELLPKIKMWNS